MNSDVIEATRAMKTKDKVFFAILEKGVYIQGLDSRLSIELRTLIAVYLTREN